MLDGEEVAIDGAKDNNSLTTVPESGSLMSLLGGFREIDEVAEPRTLPVGTVAEILGGEVGHPVEPTERGIGGALAQKFGGNSGKLMGMYRATSAYFRVTNVLLTNQFPNEIVKFALSQLSGGKMNGNTALASLASSMFSGGKAGSNAPAKLGMIMMMFAAVKQCFGSAQPASSTPSGLSAQNPLAMLLSGGDPMGSLTGMLGDLGLQGQNSVTSEGAPPYKPTPSGATRDVAILITGCQAHETSVSLLQSF